MAIGEQFAGLDMEQLIGGPLSAAANASTLLANSTADFIQKVGFDKQGKLQTVTFGYQKRSTNDDGTTNLDEMKVAVPMLAIVPIPNLQIDEVNILFDMEVKQSEKSENSKDMSASLTGSAKIGPFKISISGSVSAHESHTRSTDNSAKYHVDVRATNHGTPEGLARVLDMIAANVAPALVGSTVKDANGQDLSEAARTKAEKLKTLRQEISQIESRLTAAQNTLDDKIAQLKRAASAQQNVYSAEINSAMSKLDQDSEEGAKKAEEYNSSADTVMQRWNNVQNQAADVIRTIADNTKKDEEPAAGVSEMFALLTWKEGEAPIAYASGESQYEMISGAQVSAVKAQKNVTKIEEELYSKREEYNNAVSGAKN
ncbi:MAG: DUF2589 domain-containing protein [Roseburia sp.]|nr:DUF2589 domain-containing protein [Ruminococcus sp.]MCM1156405.1 DUF2589 domain-containing protein [Roseburia sp.]MCM1242235.1 DUF2589 domain-containing protein [Roseburia sp.]